MNPPRILVVEDHDINLHLICRKLERAGYATLIARNGLEAVEAAVRHVPDLILMDLGLPLMDGCEATKRLKQDPVTRKIPVIMLTAHVMADHRERAKEAGTDAFETKPTDFARLLVTIQACLAGDEELRGAVD
jgi:two-component system cell cycle response regulator DivK